MITRISQWKVLIEYYMKFLCKKVTNGFMSKSTELSLD
ncbi:hypothetical protein Q427_22245 [Halomonas sp. BC04]|nr:hypothetical protein Q427_22245 [Halomonas sp. BC04]